MFIYLFLLGKSFETRFPFKYEYLFLEMKDSFSKTLYQRVESNELAVVCASRVRKKANCDSRWTKSLQLSKMGVKVSRKKTTNE